MQTNYPIESVRDLRYLNPSNRYYFTRDARPDHEERYSTVNNEVPIDPHKPWTIPTKQEPVGKYKLTTISTWFLCPVGRPLSTNTVYFATDRAVFNGRYYPNVCYKINGTWYREDLFKSIKEV